MSTTMHSHQWFVTEDADGEASTVHIFGKDAEGYGQHWITSGYRPRFTIHVHDISAYGTTQKGGGKIVDELLSWMRKQSYFANGSDKVARFKKDDILYEDDVYDDNTSVNMYGYQGDRKLNVYCFSVSSTTQRTSLLRYLHGERGRSASPVGQYSLFDVQAPDHEIAYLAKSVHQTWLLAKSTTAPNGAGETECDFADIEQHQQMIVDGAPAHTTQMFFDIETFASRDGTMDCDPNIAGDVIFMVAVHIVKRLGMTVVEKHTELLYLLPEGDQELTEVRDKEIESYHLSRFRSEKQMLMAFARLFRQHDVQYVCGYNSSEFDWPYIWDRASFLGIRDAFAIALSRLGNDSPAFLTKRVTKTKQAGKREFFVLTCPGVVDLDILRFVKNFQQSGKYTNHKLDTILSVELGLHKKDMSYQRLYAAYREKNIPELNMVAQYAVGDTLPLDALAKTLDMLNRMVGVADIAVIPIQEVMYRGITNSCTNKIYHKTRSIAYSLPYKPINTMRRQDAAEAGDGTTYGLIDDDEDQDDSEAKQSYWVGDHRLYGDEDMRERNPFEGATVLESEPEFITIPVSTLDFEGLYPSLMRTYDFCYTSIIEDLEDTDLVDYANKHDDGIEIHTWDVEKLYDHQTGIHFDNMDTLIEGMLRLDKEYTSVRQKCIDRIDKAVRLLDPSAVDDASVQDRLLDMLGCEGVRPENLTSRKFSYVLYRIMTRCGQLKTDKGRYAVDDATRLRSRIQQLRKRWKSLIDHDLDAKPSAEITGYFSKKTARRFEKKTVQRRAGIVRKAAKILPSIQEELYLHRQKYKKLMKTVNKGTREYLVYDAANLAAKLFANSLYGYLATTIIPAVILAELITMRGRYSLECARHYCEVTFPEQASTTLRWSKKEAEMFPSLAVEGELLWHPSRGRLPTIIKGGDSVSGDTPILCRNAQNLEMRYVAIEEMPTAGGEWRPRKDGKEYAFTPYEIWSPNGWVRVHTVIRHLVTKDMYRVTTGRGSVDVTADHSLLLHNGKKIKPIDAHVGTVLFHMQLPNMREPSAMLDEEAWRLGFFLAGHAAAGSTKDEALFRMSRIDEHNASFLSLFGEDGWFLSPISYDDDGSSTFMIQLRRFFSTRLFGPHDAVPKPGDVIMIEDKTFLETFRSGLIINTWLSTKMSFLKGFCAYALGLRKADYQLSTIEHPCITSLPKWHLAILTHVLDAVHMDWTLDMDDGTNIRLCFPVNSAKRYRVESNVKLPASINGSRYVYDLSTLSGTFNVAPGRLHVSNTDSCFVGFDGINLEEAIALAMRCADECTDQVFSRPGSCMRFEYEKTSMPTLLGARKNSDAVQFVKDPRIATEITAKGNFKKKRSYCQFLQSLGWAYLVGTDIHPNAKPAPTMIPVSSIGGAFGAILNQKSPTEMHQAIVDVIREFLWRLYKGDVAWTELAIGAEYTYRTNAVTAVGQLAARILARKDEPLRLGQRFQIVYVFPPKDMKISQKITDAMCGEALEHVLTSKWPYKPHIGYYLRHMYSPLIRNLRIIDGGVAKTIDDLFHNMEAIFEQRSTQQSNITSHFKKAMILNESEDAERQSVLFGKMRLKRSTLKIANE